MNKTYRKLALVLAMVLILCTGCGAADDMRVVFTWGLEKDELFRVDKEAMSVKEAKLLLMTQMAGYRNLYGEAVLTRQFGTKTLEDTIKENTLSLLGKIMVMNQMADKYQISLSEDDHAKVLEAAAEYYESLSKKDKETADVNLEDVEHLLEKILLADKVFDELTGEQEIEISDDEARVVTLRHIMIKTTQTDDNGVQQPISVAKKQEAYTKSLEIFDQLLQGADFDSLSEIYNEDVRTEYSVGRGEMVQELEDAVFDMDIGETSIVLESAAGYHIIRCINNFDREATETNKSKLIAQRKWEVFEDTYNAFAEELNCEFSEKRWKEIKINPNDAVNGSLLEIYRSYFSTDDK